ncbi:hypothetical protein BKA64DRAFT_698993 [Cadophora sp. MPI-SDFR-AT-0126]|nr:hypothetical protein BKA64DRAFT_698993 [Leotiomycetes sp. MPI-SDFR-AT-0126]
MPASSPDAPEAADTQVMSVSNIALNSETCNHNAPQISPMGDRSSSSGNTFTDFARTEQSSSKVANVVKSSAAASDLVGRPTNPTFTLSDGRNSFTITGNIKISDVIDQIQKFATFPLRNSKEDAVNVEIVPVPSKNPQACLTAIPLELLNMILQFTLVNPVLGTHESVSINERYGRDAKYGLSPNLLLANKHINKLGTEVLYGKNVFYMACVAQSSRDFDTEVMYITITYQQRVKRESRGNLWL